MNERDTDSMHDKPFTGSSGTADSIAAPVLLVVALKTDQPNIERRLRTILAAADPVQPDTEPVAWAKPVDELVAADLDALAALVGWDAVSRLRVGDVVGASSEPSQEAGPPATTPVAPTTDPDTTGCPTCGGDGLDDDFRDCSQCDGSGQVPVEPEVERGY